MTAPPIARMAHCIVTGQFAHRHLIVLHLDSRLHILPASTAIGLALHQGSTFASSRPLVTHGIRSPT
eukprot:2484899-Pyramimonas_sp.AAC.1